MRKRSYDVGVIWCPNRSKNRRVVASGGARRTGWAFPPTVESHLQKSFQGKSILHLFGGRASFGTRLDVDLLVHPDVLGDAWMPPFARDSFDVVILDPPYVYLNAQLKTALFRAAAWIAREHVVWFAQTWQAASGGVRIESGWMVRVGDSCVVRALQYFRVVRKLGPVKHFTRGPQIKYNRWLAQPRGLPFREGTECQDQVDVRKNASRAAGGSAIAATPSRS